MCLAVLGGWWHDFSSILCIHNALRPALGGCKSRTRYRWNQTIPAFVVNENVKAMSQNALAMLAMSFYTLQISQVPYFTRPSSLPPESPPLASARQFDSSRPAPLFVSFSFLPPPSLLPILQAFVSHLRSPSVSLEANHTRLVTLAIPL